MFHIRMFYLTSLHSFDFNNVAYSLHKVENFNHSDDKIITSPDGDSSRTESDCSHSKQMSPAGSLMGANEQTGFSILCLLFSQSNVHSETKTYNSPLKTVQPIAEDQCSNSASNTQCRAAPGFSCVISGGVGLLLGRDRG